MKGYVELEVDIEYDTQDYEEPSKDSPGSEFDLWVTSVVHNGHELIEHLSEEALEQLNDQAYEKHIASIDWRLSGE